MTLQDHIVQIALSQVGVRETGGNNVGPEILKYQEATWLKPGAWPWCAAFCAWVLKMAAKNAELKNFIPCPDASAYGWEKWAVKRGWILLPETEPCKPGDFVTFDFSHIGVVIEDKGHSIVTVEGNTNGKGERDSESGDGVWQKTRARSLVKSFIRIPP